MTPRIAGSAAPGNRNLCAAGGVRSAGGDHTVGQACRFGDDAAERVGHASNDLHPFEPALALAARLGEEEANLVAGENGGEVIAGVVRGAGPTSIPGPAVPPVKSAVLTAAAF